ncbi:response regulator [Stappia sp. 28M-7]|uniref:response regulator n=1 Tax=Stappia sp. 28M-7 TaxID=2762596 RepID=UPI000E76743B|nr:response regulator [Stappia sp. 28M-7]MBC2860172.1 response regulator [Stappia sp. 28M-7]
MQLPHLDLSGIRVLIVDDNTNMRRILRTMVAGFGIKSIYEAEDGADALEEISRNDPDLIILDWLMPLVNGNELTHRIRTSQAPACFVPIIAVTAHTQKRRVMQARDSGVTEVMCKPISARGLYLRIANCILNQRDFVRTKGFFGPDRRRFQNPNFQGDERRGQPIEDGYALDGPSELPQSQSLRAKRESATG